MDTTTVLPWSRKAWISRRMTSEAKDSPPGLLSLSTIASYALLRPASRNWLEIETEPILPGEC